MRFKNLALSGHPAQDVLKRVYHIQSKNILLRFGFEISHPFTRTAIIGNILFSAATFVVYPRETVSKDTVKCLRAYFSLLFVVLCMCYSFEGAIKTLNKNVSPFKNTKEKCVVFESTVHTIALTRV